MKTVPGPESFPPGSGNDQNAQLEATAYAEKNLDEISQKKEHGRRERFRDHTSYGAVVILWIIMLLTAAAILAVGWHFLLPSKYHWLDDSQFSSIKTYVFSSAVIAAVTQYMQKKLD